MAGVGLVDELFERLLDLVGQVEEELGLPLDLGERAGQLVEERDDCQNAFLCRILGMYSAQLESKHQGLGDKIAETCQEVYVTVREFDAV